MRKILHAMLLVAALPATATTRTTVDVEESGRFNVVRHATVLAEGKQQRIDLRHEGGLPIVFDVLLSDDGGATYTALNTGLKTLFRTNTPALRPRPHMYVPTQGAMRRSVRAVEVTSSDELSEPIAGYATHKYVVKVAFTVRESLGALVDEKFRATILLTTTDAIDPALAIKPIDLTTGVAEVDAQLVPALAKIPGFPLKTVLSASRAFTGGPPQVFAITATVSDIRTVPAPPHAFERPADYVYQEPVFGAPGRQ